MKSTLMLGACALALPFAADAAPESYTMDPYHTYPYFIVSHFGVGNMMGRFDKTTGKFTVDTAAKTGTVDLAVETATITTGDKSAAAARALATSTCAPRTSSTSPSSRA